MQHAVVALCLGMSVAALPALAAELVLKRVLLSTGGVGYFEFEASVTDNARLPLEVRFDQVDDVLKSIVVFDEAGGVGTVRLPTRAPLDEAFRDLPFSLDDLEDPVALLNALQGAEVQVSGAKPLKGRIVRALAEETRLPDGGGVVRRHRVSVMTASGLQQFVLEEADALGFTDPALQGKLEGALAALSRHGMRERRTLEIESLGRGQRKVRVGFVAEAPLWKASYRLVIDGNQAAKQGRLQGWAVLENLSGFDWQQVDLTIVSGNPVTFRQALYTAYFVQRPEVPVEVQGRILPRADERALAAAPLASPQGASRDSPRQAQAPLLARTSGEARGRRLDLKEEADAVMERLAGGAIAAEAEEMTTQVVFRYGRPVDLPSGQTLLLPLIDRELPAERVALYQRETHARHPLAAVRLKNDGASGLPAGVLALFESGTAGTLSFAGDARLATLPIGESRLLSFALDTKVTVDREDRSLQRLARGAVSRGILRLQLVEQQATIYRVGGAGGEERRLILEHARLGGDYKLIAPAEKDVELSERHYRLPLALKAGGTATLTAIVERPIEQSIRLLDLPAQQIAAYAAAPELDARLRRAFEEIGKLRTAIDAQRQQVERLEREQKEIAADQTRIRENLGKVPRDSQIYQRYLEKLGQQESRLEQLAPLSDQARAARQRAADALADYVDKLEI